MSGETEQNISGWTVDTLRAHVAAQMADLKTLLDERHITQQTAMSTALAAAEKAVAKAEAATDKRFDGVNEFRAQLSDQAATFMSRSEADAKFGGLAGRVDAEGLRLTARTAEISLRVAEISSRLDLMQGANVGAAVSRTDARLDRGSLIALAGFAVTLVLSVLAVVTFVIARNAGP